MKNTGLKDFAFECKTFGGGAWEPVEPEKALDLLSAEFGKKANKALNALLSGGTLLLGEICKVNMRAISLERLEQLNIATPSSLARLLANYAPAGGAA